MSDSYGDFPRGPNQEKILSDAVKKALEKLTLEVREMVFPLLPIAEFTVWKILIDEGLSQLPDIEKYVNIHSKAIFLKVLPDFLEDIEDAH